VEAEGDRQGLTVRRAAEASGLSAHTLRYYERVGLLDPVGRAPNGHRRYTADDLAWISFLDRLRSTGMPIRMMLRYADLRREGPSTFAERRALLEAHGRTVRGRIKELERNLAVIEEKVALYKEMEAEGDPAGEDAVRGGPGEARGGGR
jgi:DNA-binding transcriptional MerR regulator